MFFFITADKKEKWDLKNDIMLFLSLYEKKKVKNV